MHDIADQIHLAAIVKVLLVLSAANGAPVLAKKLMSNAFSQPIDAGRTLADGRPVFGAAKTFRGVVVALLASALLAPLLAIDWTTGLLAGGSAMAGDLLSSFLKRRIGLPPSSMALGLDQIPESLLPVVVCKAPLALSAVDIVLVVTAFFIGELILSRILFWLRVRDQPY